jgi:hypothetical protein
LGSKEFSIPEDRRKRRDRQSRELEQNQQDLRTSIAESKRLVDEADALIQRHRKECDSAEGAK